MSPTQSIDQTQNDIIAEFNKLDDWFDRYQRLIERGKKHPALEQHDKTDQAAIPGCQFHVWFHADTDGDTLNFRADSDSLIIKGILSLLLRTLNQRTPAEIASANLYFLDDIGLTANLSPVRANGVGAIIKHIRQCAESELVTTQNTRS